MNSIISFLIVNWEGEQILKDCILSIEKSFSNFNNKYVDWKYEIIVVDNASLNLDYVWLTNRKYLKLFINDTNVKFAKATNQTVKESNGDYIFILNNDIVLFEDCLLLLYESIKETNNIAVPKLFYPNGRPQKSVRNLPHIKDYIYIITGLNKLNIKFDNLNLNNFDYDKKQDVEQPLFSALLLKKETWLHIGDMDENFPLLFNDVDWFFRAKNKNIKTLYIPEASAYHYHGYSVNKNRIKKVWESTISLRRYFYKNHRMDICRKILLEAICVVTFILRVIKELFIITINKFKSNGSLNKSNISL